MDIKEIALRVAKKMRAECEWDVIDLVCNSEKFAEALIAEIAKGNEPLCTAAMLDEWFLSKSGVDPKLPLYTIPPTAEQIANETAEAIAKMLELGPVYPEYIRSGAWKAFKK